MKKRITLQRLNSPEDHRRALLEIEKTLNNLRLDDSGSIVVGGSGEVFDPAVVTGPPGPMGPQGPTGPQGPAGADGTGGSGSSTRTVVTHTTGSLANLAVEDGVIAIAKGAFLYKIEVDAACWIRFYDSAAARTVDAGRSLGTPATPGIGTLAEYSFAGAGSLGGGPVPFLKNADGTPTTDIYYSITNRSGSTTAIQIDITYLPQEV
jgi:hypothetical protein